MERVIDVWAAGLANTSDSIVISKIESTWTDSTTMRVFAAVVDAQGFSALTQFEILFL